MSTTELDFAQIQSTVWNNRNALKAMGHSIPKKIEFLALPEEPVRELYASLSATDNSSEIDDKEVADVTGVEKHTARAGGAYYTTPCKFIAFEGVSAMFEILHGTHAGRKLCVSRDKDLFLLDRQSPIPVGTIMNFGYTHGKEPFKFLGNIVTENSVCFSNSDAENRSLGRLIKALSPELFQGTLDIATEIKQEVAVIDLEEALLAGVDPKAYSIKKSLRRMDTALDNGEARERKVRAEKMGLFGIKRS
jgi:hypothetical protein|tara:strand:- start:209 stop:955 length:747 start_codon:yes stop_codon:yes gene_type:complete